jgi:biotin carboxyl carrier protein
MPDRLHLVEGRDESVAEVLEDHVALLNPRRRFAVRETRDGRFSVLVDRREGGPGVADSEIAGTAARSGNVVWVSVEGFVFEIGLAAAARRTVSDEAALAPPMPATVVRIAVSPGQRVSQGDLLVALEAMKMELPLRAPRDGVVRAIHCREGDLVQPGTVLIEL